MTLDTRSHDNNRPLPPTFIGGVDRRTILRTVSELPHYLNHVNTIEDIQKLCGNQLSIWPINTVALYYRRKTRGHCHQFFANDSHPLPTTIKSDDTLLEHMNTTRGPGLHVIPTTPIDAKSSTLYYLPITTKGQLIGFYLITEPASDDSQDSDLSWVCKMMKICGELLIQKTLRHLNSTEVSNSYASITKLFDNSEEFISSWHRDTGWAYHNEHILYRIGYKPSEVQPENIFGCRNLMSKQDWERCELALNNTIDGLDQQVLRFTLLDAKNKEHVFQSKISVIENYPLLGESTIVAVSAEITQTYRFVKSNQENAKLDAWLLDVNAKLFNTCNEQSMQVTLEECIDKLDFDRCSIRLYEDHDHATLLLEARKNSVKQTIPGLQTIAINPKFRNNSFIFEDIKDDGRLEKVKAFAKEAGVSSAIARPIIHKDQVLGIFVCANEHPRRFTSRELRATQVISETLGMVLTKENLVAKLNLSKERFHMAMEAASYGLWEINLSEQTIYLSPNYYAMLGYDPERYSGFHPISGYHLHIDDQEIVLEYARKLTAGEIDDFSLEIRHITRDGDILWILMRGKVISWDDLGKPICAMGTMTDISDIKKAETDIELAHQHALSAHHAKSEFLARMSHEIRTPMNAIIGMAYLTMQTQLNDELRSKIVDIENSAKSLLNIIDDILDFSKIEADKLVIEYHPFNLKRHLTRALSPHTTLAQKKNLTLNIAIAEDVPAFVSGDSTRIRQVLANLVHNAIKFTREGHVDVSIHSEEEVSNVVLHCSVKDTGIGINAAQIDQLFDAFTQADGSSSREFGGTGLGLAIAKKLIEMMGGQIQVTSHPKQGTVIEFTLRCQAVNSDSQPTPGLSQHSSEAAARQNSREILLVEDNPVNQKVAQGVLIKRGYDVTIASNGKEAIDKLQQHNADHFAVVLMDIEMPVLDGFAATQRIRALGSYNSLPIIGMTAHQAESARNSCIEAGMDDIVSKPISPSALYAKLEQYCTLHRA
ncbi:ATP-binding protein [Aurantivibrio plasticivorans]